MMSTNEKWIYSAWVVALVATLGSLYLSEVMLFQPCELCWYQRICMYPLAIMLGIAALRGHTWVKPYGIIFASIGLFISIFHYMEQKVPGFANIRPCKFGVPCSEDYLDWFGVITIPFMAGIAFVLIIVALMFVKQQEEIE